MNKSVRAEIILVLGLIVLIFVTLDPLGLHMNHMWYMALCGLITAVYFTATFFLWGEKYSDEREYEHRYFASRVAYMAGSAVLIFAMVFQSFVTMVNPWLPTTLITMFVAKLVARLYSEKYR